MESTAPPARCEIARLPDDLLSATLALTSPRDACCAAAVSPTFRAAADADAVWSSFLPRDLPPLADGELPADPRFTKKQLFMRLSDPGSPVLLADGLTSMWLDRATGVMCYMLSARKLGIAWGDTPQYWRWIPITVVSRISEAAELRHVWWLEIRGEVDSKMLSRHTTYGAYIVFSLAQRRLGLHYCKEASLSLGGSSRCRQVCLEGGHDGAEDTRPSSLPGDLPQDTLFPRVRGDGWMEVELGEFCSGEGDDGEISISLMETSILKSGLVVLGIEIRPKEQVV